MTELVVRWLFDESMAEALRQAVCSTLADAFQISVRPHPCFTGHEMPLAIGSLDACKIDIVKEDILCGVFIAAYDRDVIFKILQLYNPDGVNDPLVIGDAVEEVTNMIYGAFKTHMNKAGHHFALELPLALRGKDGLLARYEHAEKMILRFSADGSLCHIVVAQS